MTHLSDAELEAYLDESLPVERMAAIEGRLGEDDQLQARLVAINGRRDAGVHSLGEIWRRHRVSCPSREQLGSYLLGVLDDQEAGYVKFHLEQIGCRFCSANLEDLAGEQAAADDQLVAERRQKYFHSSAGYLRRDD